MRYNPQGTGASSESLTNYKVIRIGDVAFEGHTNREFQYGRFVVNDLGDGIMSPRFSVLRPVGPFNISYWKQYLHCERYINRILVRSTKAGTMMNELVYNDLSKEFVYCPSNNEQQKIGKLLSKVDFAITLHEEKKHQLERLKSALLQKMFADKSGYPAVRFEGFSDEWEQAKFGEITKKYKIRNKQGRILKSFSVSNSNGFVPQELQFENGGYALNADKTNSIIVKPNSFAYNPARINVGSIGYYNGDKDILVSSLYEVFTLREGFDSKYMWYWIKSNNFDRWIYRLQEGSVRSYFYYDKFSEIKEVLPTLDEQKKIGQLLSKLDSVINVHDRALYLLKMIKQSLLQKMFI